MASNRKTDAEMGMKRVTFRMSLDMYERLCYWARRHGWSTSAYMAHAVDQAIRWENRDYELPVAEQRRLTQLVDHIDNLSASVDNLSRIVTSGIGSIVTVAQGDSYLLNDYGSDDSDAIDTFDEPL